MFPPMTSLPTYIASDAHLGAAPPEMEYAFHLWLEAAAGEAGLILLNGDLFDFWFEWGTVIPRGHTRTLGLLARIVDAGVQVHLMGGNHDWWGGSYLTEEVGVTFHQDPVHLDLAGSRALVAHGDGLGDGDLGYRALQVVLRSQLARIGFRILHPDLGTALARRVSRTEVDSSADSAKKRRANVLERWARDRLVDDEELDLVVLGHSHVPRRVEVASGRYYLNSGDWIRHGTYFVLREGRPPELKRWEMP